jgi:transcriptional regulator with XRE-family HTH domain
MDMGVRLAELRRAAGLSQERLARLADVGTDAVRKWERGKRTPSLKMAIKLARTLGVSLDDLAGFETPAAKKPARKRKGEAT